MLRIAQVIGIGALLAVASIIIMTRTATICEASPGSVAALFAPQLVCDRD